jgi:hypothetical protein
LKDLDEIRRNGYTNYLFSIPYTQTDKSVRNGEILMLGKVTKFIDSLRIKYGLKAKIKEVEK